MSGFHYTFDVKKSGKVISTIEKVTPRLIDEDECEVLKKKLMALSPEWADAEMVLREGAVLQRRCV